MTTFCYIFIFAFEQFIAYLYFNNKFEIKRNERFILISYIVSFVLQYLINLTNIQYLNIVSFLLFNIAIVYICFEANWKQIIFNTLLLCGIMMTTEVIVMYAITSILNINFLEYSDNELIIFFETAASKMLYFLVSYIISKLSFKEYSKKKVNDIAWILFVLPLISIITIICFGYFSINLVVSQTINVIFSIISLLLLSSNMIVFFVHEKMITILTENTELLLEKQKEEINNEYYMELEKQYNSSNILIHDTKRCLLNIRELSVEKDTERIIQYIDSIYNGYEIKTLKQYSNNKLVNVIVSRYAQLYENEKFDFSVDIRNVDFSFISDSDITALLDNLLENAYEAAKTSKNKIVDLTIDKQNEKYILIKLSNSSDTNPKIVNDTIETTKNDGGVHGIGIKSIMRIVKRYSGNLEWNFDDNLNLFTTTIILESNKH